MLNAIIAALTDPNEESVPPTLRSEQLPACDDSIPDTVVGFDLEGFMSEQWDIDYQ